MLALLLAMTTFAPQPNPHIKWTPYPAGGLILCAPADSTRLGPTPCIVLPPGSMLIIPTLTTEPDPEEEGKKT